MLAPRIIPCLDVSHGRVVKGVRFQGLRDAGDPAERAALYEAQGADEIVILDVSATPEGRGNQVETVRRVRARLGIPLTVGGGVRSLDDARALLEAGRRQGLGQHRSRAGAGAARRDRRALRPPVHGPGDRCGTARWPLRGPGQGRPRGHRHRCDPFGRARRRAQGAGEILLTSWDRDGTRSGYDLELIRAVREAVHVPVIASGGAAGRRASARGVRGRRRCGARRLDLPRRRSQRRRRQADPDRARASACGHDRPLDRPAGWPGGPADRRRDQGARCRRSAPDRAPVRPGRRDRRGRPRRRARPRQQCGGDRGPDRAGALPGRRRHSHGRGGDRLARSRCGQRRARHRGAARDSPGAAARAGDRGARCAGMARSWSRAGRRAPGAACSSASPSCATWSAAFWSPSSSARAGSQGTDLDFAKAHPGGRRRRRGHHCRRHHHGRGGGGARSDGLRCPDRHGAVQGPARPRRGVRGTPGERSRRRALADRGGRRARHGAGPGLFGPRIAARGARARPGRLPLALARACGSRAPPRARSRSCCGSMPTAIATACASRCARQPPGFCHREHAHLLGADRGLGALARRLAARAAGSAARLLHRQSCSTTLRCSAPSCARRRRSWPKPPRATT